MNFTADQYDVFNKVVDEVDDKEEFERIVKQIEKDKLLTLSELRFLAFYAGSGNDKAKQMLTDGLENIYNDKNASTNLYIDRLKYQMELTRTPNFNL